MRLYGGGVIEHILILQTCPNGESARLRALLEEACSSGREDMLHAIAEALKDEGRAEGITLGRTEGIEAGRVEGEAKPLVRLLERRFGPLSRARKAKIRNSETGQIETWGDRALFAGTIDEVFEGE